MFCHVASSATVPYTLPGAKMMYSGFHLSSCSMSTSLPVPLEDGDSTTARLLLSRSMTSL